MQKSAHTLQIINYINAVSGLIWRIIIINKIMEAIQQQLIQFIQKEPSVESLAQFARQSFESIVKPTAVLNQIDLSTLTQPTALYAEMMVQDIRDASFYYPLIIQTPITKSSKFHFTRYGALSEEIMELLDDDSYVKIPSDRQIIICSSIRYETQWLKKLKKHEKDFEALQLIFEGRSEFKLGQTIHCVVIWQPTTKKLHYVRKVEQQQKKEQKLDVWELLVAQNETDFLKQRENLMKIFNNVSSERYSKFLLFTLLSNQSFFINGENVQDIVKELLPRVYRLKIQVPFKKSLFPYKNENNELIKTPMQTSNQSTFIILDFDSMVTEKEIKIDGDQINNLKALKFFVEEGKTIYRWEYGQSQVTHNHRGIVVKASSIITPNYHLKDEAIKTQKNPLSDLTEEQKLALRLYIESARKLKPLLDQQTKNKIHNDLKENREKYHDINILKKIMELAKLNAMSYGRTVINWEDYQLGCEFLL